MDMDKIKRKLAKSKWIKLWTNFTIPKGSSIKVKGKIWHLRKFRRGKGLSLAEILVSTFKIIIGKKGHLPMFKLLTNFTPFGKILMKDKSMISNGMNKLAKLPLNNTCMNKLRILWLMLIRNLDSNVVKPSLFWKFTNRTLIKLIIFSYLWTVSKSMLKFTMKFKEEKYKMTSKEPSNTRKRKNKEEKRVNWRSLVVQCQLHQWQS